MIALAYGLATAFSIVPRASLVGSYFRLQGTLTMLAYLTLFAAATTHLRRPDQVKRVLGSVVLTSLPVALYALVQHLGWDPLAPWDMDARARPPANLGNPVFLGGYLAMSTLVVLGSLTARLNRMATHADDGLLTFCMTCAYGVILALNLVAVGLTQSRGPIVGLSIGLICYLCLLATTVRSLRRFATVALLLLVVSVGVLGLVAVRAGTAGRVHEQAGSRWAVFDTQHGTVGIRMAIWKGVVNLLTASKPLALPGGGVDAWHALRPFLGYGPESLAAAFRPGDHPDITRLEGSPVFVDRAHNETLDTLATTGLLGVIGYFWLIAAVVWRGMTSLGALGSRRARRQLTGLVVASVVAAGVLLTLWNGPAMLGLAIPLGAVFGVLLHLALSYLPDRAERFVRHDDLAAEGSIILIALMAATVAHFIEISFGVATVATRTHFWLFAALVALDGAACSSVVHEEDVGDASVSTRAADCRTPERGPSIKGIVTGASAMTRWKEASVGAVLLSMVLATLAHDFLALDIRTARWGRLFVEGAAKAPAGVPSWVSLGLFAGTWLVGCLVVLEVVTSSSPRIRRLGTLGWAVPGLSLALGTLCWVLRGRELTGIARIAPSDVASMLALGERITRLSEHYAIALLALALALAFALSPSGTPLEQGSGEAVADDRCTVWDVWKFSVVAAVALWLVNGVGLRPIRADTLYNVGRQLHPGQRQLTIELYRQAAAVALYEDQYALEVQGLSSK